MLPKSYADDEQHDWCQGRAAVELELMQLMGSVLPLRLVDSEEPMMLLAKDALSRGLLLLVELLVLLLVAVVVVVSLLLLMLLLLLVVVMVEPLSI